MQQSWQRQTAAQPLFPNLLWSRPENRAFAGKIAIIGGNGQSFRAPAEAYTHALMAGAGSLRVLLPDSLLKTVTRLFPEAEFGASTPSGSLGSKSLIELLDLGTWADVLLLAGDFGNNSETAILLENFTSKFDGQLAISDDAADVFIQSASVLQQRGNTLLVLDFQRLQKLATSLHFTEAFTSKLPFIVFVELLRQFSESCSLYLVVKHLDSIFVAVAGTVSVTACTEKTVPSELPALAAHAAVWWLQNPSKPFEAITTALVAD